MSISNRIVHIWEFPQNVYLDLDAEYKRQMLETARKLSGSWRKLAKILNYDNNTFFNLRLGQKVKLGFIIRISEFLVEKDYLIT